MRRGRGEEREPGTSPFPGSIPQEGKGVGGMALANCPPRTLEGHLSAVLSQDTARPHQRRFGFHEKHILHDLPSPIFLASPSHFEGVLRLFPILLPSFIVYACTFSKALSSPLVFFPLVISLFLILVIVTSRKRSSNSLWGPRAVSPSPRACSHPSLCL